MQQNNDNAGIILEMQRKVIHLSCMIFPLLYFYLLSQEQMLWLMSLLSTGFLFAEWLRYKTAWGKSIFDKFFLPLLRNKETTGGLTGATFLLLAITLTIAVFSKIVAIAAISVLIIADSMAAIIGKQFGKHAFFQKSVEGSVTFFVVTCLIFYYLMPESRMVLTAVAAVVSFAEAAPFSLDDNIVIPLTAGTLLQWLI